MNLIEFFDEINGLEYERKQLRIKKAQRLEADFVYFFNEVFEDILEQRFLYTKAFEEYVAELEEIMYKAVISDNITDTIPLRIHLQEAAEEIMQTTVNAYLEPESGTEFDLARNRGAPMRLAIIPESVVNAFSRKRIQRIAANESLYASSLEEQQDAVAKGKKFKIWNTMEDERVRPSHVFVDKKEIPIDKPFQVGNSLLMFPGDTSLGADPSEIIMCRCWLTYR